MFFIHYKINLGGEIYIFLRNISVKIKKLFKIV